MTWTKIAEHAETTTAPVRVRVPSTDGFKGHSTSSRTRALDLWRCDGCRRLACGAAGENPGRCLNRGCRYYNAR